MCSTECPFSIVDCERLRPPPAHAFARALGGAAGRFAGRVFVVLNSVPAYLLGMRWW